MSKMPSIFSNKQRAPVMLLVALIGIAQAIAAGVAAFATRDVFVALGSELVPMQAILVLLLSAVSIALLRIGERIAGEYVGQHYAADLRTRLFRHLTNVPQHQISNRRTGSLALRFIGDLSAIRVWVSLGITRLISALFVVPGALIALCLLEPAFSYISAASLCLAIIVMWLFQPKLAPLHQKLRYVRAKIAADMSERIPVASELRIQGRAPKEFSRLARHASDLRWAAVKRRAASCSLVAVPEIAISAAAALFFMVAIHLKLGGPEVAASLAILSILAQPLTQLATIWDRFRAWKIARQKCQSILKIPSLKQLAKVSPVKTSEESPSRVKRGLVFENVSTKHLKPFSARIEHQKSVVILGPNGAGKSTILELIANMEIPETGQISLDCKQLSQADLCYVGLNSPVLRGSLRRAMTMG